MLLLRPLKLKPERHGQLNSKPFKKHGLDLLMTSIPQHQNLLPPKPRSNPASPRPGKPDGPWIKPSFKISKLSPTIPLTKEKNSPERSKPTSSKRKPSTKLTLMLTTTK
jgi:hypothetical protein